MTKRYVAPFGMAILEKRFAFEDTVTLRAGEYAFRENDDNRDLFIIQEGVIQIVKQTPQGEVQLTEFIKGEFFGDMALLQGGPRFAGARAKTNCRLLVLRPGGFLLKIRRDPTFAFEMLQQLSQRIKVSNERLFTVIQKGGISKGDAQQIFDAINGR